MQINDKLNNDKLNILYNIYIINLINILMT